MERLKILAIVARLMFLAESDGLTCRVDSATTAPWRAPSAIVDCSGNGNWRRALVHPSGRVIVTFGRTT